MCQPAFGGLRIPLLATNLRASPIFVLVRLFDVFILVVASVRFVLAFPSRFGRFWTNFGRLSLFVSLSFIFLRMWIVPFKPEVINDPLNPMSANIDGTKVSTRTWVVRTILNCAFKLFIEPSSPLSLSRCRNWKWKEALGMTVWMESDQIVPKFSVQVIEEVVLNFKPRYATWSCDNSGDALEDLASPVIQDVDVALVVEIEFWRSPAASLDHR